MGQRGKPPDPIPLKILKGRGNGVSSGGYKIPDPPAFTRGAPDPPEWLSPNARELWDQIAPGLERLDLLKPEDLTAFCSYCEAWATYREALAEVRRDGLITTNPTTGHAHRNPALQSLENAGTQLLRYAQQFGLTPAAEVALARPSKVDETDDPFAGDGQQQSGA